MRFNPRRPAIKQEQGGLEFNHYSAREIFRRMWPLLKVYRLQMFISVVLVSLVGLAVAVIPLFTKYVIDVAVPKRSFRIVLTAMLLFVISQFARMGFWYLAQRMVFIIKEKIIFKLRSDGLQHMQELSFSFHNRYPSGLLYDRFFGTAISNVGEFIHLAFQSLAVDISGLIFSLWFCIYLSPPMTLVIIIASLCYIWVGNKISPRIYAKTLIYIKQGNKTTQYIMDKLRGIKTIQAFAIEPTIQNEFGSRVWTQQLKFMIATLERMKLGFISEGMGYLLTAVIFIGGAYSIFKWDMKIGTLVAFIGYQGQLIGTVSGLLAMYSVFMAARAGFDQIFTILDIKSDIRSIPGTVMPREIKGCIELKQVSFSYDVRPVIKNMNLTVPPGQNVALVGRSGGGKTTLANLLMRFYDPKEGRILLDGSDIRNLPVREYRKLFGIVMQDSYLFDDTIAANLRYAKPGATDEELKQVLTKAYAVDFVNQFPEGLNHRVGEAGGQLSGGQRQRLAIARCMLMNPSFLILDEATAALDTESELYIQQALEELFKGRTSFVIAHRLSTVRDADRILVIDDGEIVEDGTFDALLQQKKLFYHLYTLSTVSRQAARDMLVV